MQRVVPAEGSRDAVVAHTVEFPFSRIGEDDMRYGFRRALAFVIFYAVAAGGAASAKSWSCRNEQFEIHCDKNGCESSAAGEFTPMGVGLDGRTFDVCAYETCWSGRARVHERDHVVHVHAGGLAMTANPKSKARFDLLLDTKAGVAVLLGEGFAQPMTCKLE
ncbi:hypothetical protein GCM10007904_30850 [Oharaeibacter diazotrophicus]|nr:hypothetical protein GCM10007904_30850 [Oharaeibacter diazotrophicus]